jgi:hypothetical protein
MTRTEKLLEGINLAAAVGIEIGALDKPIIPPTSPGVFYVDHVDTPALREKYRDDPQVDTSKLVHVGGVWGEKGLPEIAASVAPADFLVASHVIEHVPDLIAWLNEIAAVLKNSGSLRLAIPDRRYTFDLLRSETVLADVLAAHLVGARVPQIRQIIDQVANVAAVDTWHVWDGLLDRSALKPIHPPEDIEAWARDVLENHTYRDVHCWVFTPSSFARLMGRMAELGYHSFKCTQHFATEYRQNEFIVHAQPGAGRDEAMASWQAMFDDSERDAVRKEEGARAAAAAHAVEIQGAELAALRSQVADLRATVEAIKHSTSWKVTAPMRSVVHALRRGR